LIKASIDLQDLRRRIYAKVKAEPSRCGVGWKGWSTRLRHEDVGLVVESEFSGRDRGKRL
jgi:hypothetical protein